MPGTQPRNFYGEKFEPKSQSSGQHPFLQLGCPKKISVKRLGIKSDNILFSESFEAGRGKRSYTCHSNFRILRNFSFRNKRKYRLRDWESEVIIFDSLSHLKQVLGNGLTPAIAIVSVLCKIFHSEIIYHYLNVCAVENITLSSPRASRYIRRKSHILYPYLFCNF